MALTEIIETYIQLSKDKGVKPYDEQAFFANFPFLTCYLLRGSSVCDRNNFISVVNVGKLHYEVVCSVSSNVRYCQWESVMQSLPQTLSLSTFKTGKIIYNWPPFMNVVYSIPKFHQH